MKENSDKASFDLPNDTSKQGCTIDPDYRHRKMKTYPVYEFELKGIKSYNSSSSLALGFGGFLASNFICNQESVPLILYLATGFIFILSGVFYWRGRKIISDIKQSVDNPDGLPEKKSWFKKCFIDFDF